MGLEREAVRFGVPEPAHTGATPPWFCALSTEYQAVGPLLSTSQLCRMRSYSSPRPVDGDLQPVDSVDRIPAQFLFHLAEATAHDALRGPYSSPPSE